MVVSAIITTRLALPIMLVALAVVALVGGSLLIVVLVLGLMIWNRFALVMRASTQQLRSMDYVNAYFLDRTCFSRGARFLRSLAETCSTFLFLLG